MRALIFDTETSGLIENRTLRLDKQPEIIEFYGADVDLVNGKILDELDVLIKPARPIDDEITRITGLTAADLEGKPPFAQVSQSIRELIERAPLVIAHNLSFDQEMVDIEFERLGQTPIAWPRCLCTVEQTIHIKGFRMNLSGLHEYLFGEPFAGAHRAKVDVAALIRCCVELYGRELL